MTVEQDVKILEQVKSMKARIAQLEAENLLYVKVLQDTVNYLNWNADELTGDDLVGDGKRTLRFNQQQQMLREVLFQASVFKKTPLTEQLAKRIEALEHLYQEAQWYMQDGDLHRLEQALITLREVKQANREVGK